MFVLLSYIIACVGSDAKDTFDEACYAHDVASCAADAGCTTLDGREITIPDTGGATCYNLGTAEPLSCVPAGTSCPAVITFAASPDGGPCYMLTSGCIPDGWVACETDYNAWSEC